MVVSGGGELADVGRAPGEFVHAFERIVHIRLARDGERMQHGVGAAAHCHVERERVVERVLRDELPRQRAALLRHRDGTLRRRPPEFHATRIGGENRAVARQRDAQRLVEAVHGIGREHAAARTAAGAGSLLDLLKLAFGDLADVFRADGLEDGIEVRILAGLGMVTRRHRSARGEDGGDVDAQGAQQHARHDLVAVRNADERVEAVGAHDGLHRIRNQFAAGQGKLHAGMRHRDAVADGDRVELHRNAARVDHGLLDDLAHLVEVAMSRHERLVGVADADERLLHVGALHACRKEQRPVRRALVTQLDLIRIHFQAFRLSLYYSTFGRHDARTH